MFRLSLSILLSVVVCASSFCTPALNAPIQNVVAATDQYSICSFESSLQAHREKSNIVEKPSSLVGKAGLMAMAALVFSTSPVYADEYGRETEAPTLFTGETEMICTKRGPLGACTKTEVRTVDNDNDKSEKYFKDPTELVKRKDEESRAMEASEGNALIEKLKRQTEENREKNELLVQQKTFMNDKSASFGPFDRQVLILNEDGRGFSLLENPQAMRLKEAGLIKDKKFVRQPTEEELEAALTPPDGPNLLQRILGE